MNKIINILLTLMLVNLSLLAQAPQKIAYQAVVRDSSNALISNSIVGMKVSVLQGSVSGAAVYIETQSPMTNSNGLISIEIGGGVAVLGSFALINWANGPFFIKTEIDPTGGSNYIISAASQLLSVPYALHSKTAESLVGGGGAFTHFVGELYGGGVIFHVYRDSNGQEHGLIVSLISVSDSAQWGLYGVNVPNCESFWNGQSNTNAIIAAGGLATDAAGICDSYSGGGFSDWYLPSISELNIFVNNLFNVNKTLASTPGALEVDLFQDYCCWSSTELVATNAITTFFSGELKSEFFAVRAIREF